MKRITTRTRPSAKKTPRLKPPIRKLPPFLIYNEECVERARAALAVYCDLSVSEAETAVCDLLHAMIHLCDRDTTLGKFDDGVAWAYSAYEDVT